ncbi:hypothetical protein J6590_068101 [Homalodisca vitripennis]|nr:hypothetical protein J6590_068101 [Homalodisca vitripennis]
MLWDFSALVNLADCRILALVGPKLANPYNSSFRNLKIYKLIAIVHKVGQTEDHRHPELIPQVAVQADRDRPQGRADRRPSTPRTLSSQPNLYLLRAAVGQTSLTVIPEPSGKLSGGLFIRAAYCGFNLALYTTSVVILPAVLSFHQLEVVVAESGLYRNSILWGLPGGGLFIRAAYCGFNLALYTTSVVILPAVLSFHQLEEQHIVGSTWPWPRPQLLYCLQSYHQLVVVVAESYQIFRGWKVIFIVAAYCGVYLASASASVVILPVVLSSGLEGGLYSSSILWGLPGLGFGLREEAHDRTDLATTACWNGEVVQRRVGGSGSGARDTGGSARAAPHRYRHNTADRARQLVNVTAYNILACSVKAYNILACSVTAYNILADSMTAYNILVHSLTAYNVLGRSLITCKILARIVTAYKILARSVTAYNILARIVTAYKILALSVTAYNVMARSVTAYNILARIVTAYKILALSVTAYNVMARSVTAYNILALSVNSNEPMFTISNNKEVLALYISVNSSK